MGLSFGFFVRDSFGSSIFKCPLVIFVGAQEASVQGERLVLENRTSHFLPRETDGLRHPTLLHPSTSPAKLSSSSLVTLAHPEMRRKIKSSLTTPSEFQPLSGSHPFSWGVQLKCALTSSEGVMLLGGRRKEVTYFLRWSARDCFKALSCALPFPS